MRYAAMVLALLSATLFCGNVGRSDQAAGSQFFNGKDLKGWEGLSQQDREHFAVEGPQCDMGQIYWGSLYGEHFLGDRMMKAAPKATVDKVLKKEDFNEYYIKCVGKHVTIKLNGETTVDQDFSQLPGSGIIAWQLHAGQPMEVIFKDIQFKDLSK
jgi:hypothetical protein